MTIQQRIAQIVDVKAGSQKKFAEQFGWKPQYVAKIVSQNGSVGIEPVTKILEAYPDIDGRWLILGEGDMINVAAFNQVRTSLYNSVRNLLDLERYLPYMSSSELEEYKKAAAGLNQVEFSQKQVDRWETVFKERSANAKS